MTITKKCDWCPDDTCSDYWKVQVFSKVHRICNCCYKHLRKETHKEREEEYINSKTKGFENDRK